MKKVLFILALGALGACSDTTQSTTESSGPPAVERVANQKQYACPMKCEGDKTYAEAGTCPVCKMDLKEVAMAEADTTQHAH